MVAIDDLDLIVGLDVSPRDLAAGVLLDADHSGLLAVVLDHQRLHIEHDVGHVVQHAGQRGEFVLGAVQFDLSHGAPFQAGKENATQAVADGHAEPALERFHRELAVGARQGRTVCANLTGQLESAPTNTHGYSLQTNSLFTWSKARRSTASELGARCRPVPACEARAPPTPH